MPSMPSSKNQSKQSPSENHGEGNYTAARNYEKDVGDFLDKRGTDVERLAKEAADALKGPDGDTLRGAEAAGKSHSKGDDPQK